MDADGGSYTNDRIDIGRDGMKLNWSSDGKNANLGAGAIQGLLDTLTGSTEINAGIPYYQKKLDDFAATLAGVFNNIVHADNPANPDKCKYLLQGDINGNITAGSIAVSDLRVNDPSYVMREKNPDGDLDNTDILAMKAALEQSFDFGGGFNGSFSEFINDMTNTLGSGLKSNASRLDAALAIAESVDSDRMSVSGVSLNEEGISMMTYNKAFQAMGRMMTTMDEQLDIIINQMGLVGR